MMRIYPSTSSVLLSLLIVGLSCVGAQEAVSADAPRVLTTTMGSNNSASPTPQLSPSPSPVSNSPLSTLYVTYETIYGITMCGPNRSNLLALTGYGSLVTIPPSGEPTVQKKFFSGRGLSTKPIACTPDETGLLMGAGRSLVRRALVNGVNETLQLTGAVQGIAVSKSRNKAYIAVVDAPYGAYEVDLASWTAIPLFAVPSSNMPNVSIALDISLTPDESTLYVQGALLYKYDIDKNTTTIFKTDPSISYGFAVSNTARYGFYNDVFYNTSLQSGDSTPMYQRKAMLVNSGVGLFDKSKYRYCLAWLDTLNPGGNFEIVCLDLSRMPDLPSESPSPIITSPSPNGASPTLSPSPVHGSPTPSPSTTSSPLPDTNKGFFKKNKWALPTFIGLGILAVAGIGVFLLKFNRGSTIDHRTLIDDDHHRA